MLTICYSLFSQDISKFRISDLQTEKINYLNLLAESSYNAGRYDSAIIYNEYVYNIANKNNLLAEKCFALKEIGVLNELMGNYPKALEYLFASLSIAESNNLKSFEAAININIGIVYCNLRNADKAIEHGNKALFISEAEKDTVLMVKSLNNLGNANMTLLNEWQTAESYFNRCVLLAKKIGYHQATMVGMNNLCQIYMNSGREKDALDVTNKMLELYPKNPYIYYNLGNLYRQNKDNSQAISYYLQALKLSVPEIELKQILLKDISDIEYEIGNFNKSFEFYKEFITLKDSVHSNDQAKYILELEAKYENQKNETEISELKAQNLKSRRYYSLMISSGIILLLILVLIISMIYNKRIIATQRIKTLENESVLIAATATLTGEEKERLRLSRELHDGLGGFLSSVKLSLANAIDEKQKSEIGTKSLDKSYKLLTQSISEMHRISNALLPETLLNLGLHIAIKNFCNTFNNQNNLPKINYNFFGENIRFGKFFELNVYRLTQEIINNAVKHSGASKIDIQLIIDENR